MSQNRRHSRKAPVKPHRVLGYFSEAQMTQPNDTLSSHLVRSAQLVAPLMARAVWSMRPSTPKGFRKEARRLAGEVLGLPARFSSTVRQATIADTASRWEALAATALRQMKTQRQTRRRPSILG